MENLRNEITEVIGITYPNIMHGIGYRLLDSTKESGYTRHLIEYDSYDDKVIAFLLRKRRRISLKKPARLM